MKTFAIRFPVLFSVAATLIAMLCLMWPLWISGLTLSAQVILGRIAICLFAVVLLTNLNWWGEVGFVRLKSWRTLLPYLPLLLLVTLGKISELTSIGIHMVDFKLILLGLVVYTAGGFMEEAIFRGVVLRTMLPGGLIKAALLSSLIFAVVHFANLIGGANLNDTILQVIVAFFVGLAFIGPLAVTRNIWPLVIIHTLNNFIAYLVVGGFTNTAETSQSPTFASAIVTVVPWLLLSIYSVWLLRRVGINKQKRAALSEPPFVYGGE